MFHLDPCLRHGTSSYLCCPVLNGSRVVALAYTTRGRVRIYSFQWVRALSIDALSKARVVGVVS